MFIVVCLAIVSACGGSPSSPTSQIPDVAGTYTGSLTWTADGAFVASIQARLTVVQAGAQLTVSGSLTLLGQTVQVAAVTGTVNATGFFTVSGGGFAGAVDDATCGTIRGTSASLTFSGNTARYVETDTTDFCGNWNFSGTLTKN